jgi:hypothetical protein
MYFDLFGALGYFSQDEDFELVDGYLLRFRHRAILTYFGSFISPEKNRSPAITALTKLPGETRLAAAHRAAANPIARKVKLADNADNMDLSRIPNPTAKDWARLEEYKAVRAILLAADAESEIYL